MLSSRARRTISLRATQPSMDVIEKKHSKKNCNHTCVGARFLQGKINTDSLILALQDLIRRHEVLRAYKISTNPVLGIYSPEKIEAKLPFKFIDVSDQNLSLPNIDAPGLMKMIGDDFFTRSFEYFAGPLWDSRLVKLNSSEYQFFMLFNQIIVDNRTTTILLRDLATFYNAHEENKVAVLPKIPEVSDLSFLIPDKIKQERLDFWRAELDNLNPIQLHPDKSSQLRFPFPGQRISFNLPADYLENIRRIYGNYSDETIYLAVIFTVLHILTHEDDICIGITAANRTHESIPAEVMNNLANAFFQCAPFREKVASELVFKDVLDKIDAKHAKILGKLLPIHLIQSEALPRERKNLIFASPYSIIVSVNPARTTLDFVNATSEIITEPHCGWSKMEDFGINIQGNNLTIEFNTDKYAAHTMELLFERIKLTFELACKDPQKKIGDFDLLLPSELKLIKEYNNTVTPYRTNYFLHEYLHHVALTAPERVAIVAHEKNGNRNSITYGELDRLSTILANNLPIKLGERVAITIPRSINLFIAMFAVMKKGGVFVNLDINDKALSQKLDLAVARLVICLDNHIQMLPKVSCIALDNHERCIQERFGNYSVLQHVKINSNSPAYIMFTSGTSGKTPLPKGVLCNHGGLLNLFNNMIEERMQNIQPPVTSGISTSPGPWDAIVFDFLMMSSRAGVIHLTPNEYRINAHVISKIIRAENIDYAVFPAPILAELSTSLPLKSVVSMGAKPHPKLVEFLLKANPKLDLSNGYGLTETSIAITNQRQEINSHPNEIGKPIINSEILILHPIKRTLCPLNVIGEIYNKGKSVSESYLDESQNLNRFIWMRPGEGNSFVVCDKHHLQAEKYYATGDLACFKKLKNGLTVEIGGRSNREVKLSGAYKMDLDAVESVIRNAPVTKDTYLSFDPKTGISVYVVSMNKQLTTQQIRTEIRKAFKDSTLPVTAYPKAIRKITHVPKSTNGKVLVQEIPNVIVHDYDPKVKERSEIQQRLIKIFATKFAPEDDPSYADTIETDKTLEELGIDSLDVLNLEFKIFLEFFAREENDLPSFIEEGCTIESLEKKIKDRLSANEYLNIPGYVYQGGSACRYKPPSKNSDKRTENINNENPRNLQH